MNIKIPRGASVIIDRLESLGYDADIVGGSVRDAILGNTPYDYDITTSALPEEIKSAFSDFRIIDTGIRHGTVTVMLDSEPYEVTTYRVDGEYEDNRHPKSVIFTSSLAEDLSRRDFTVNAMAYSERAGLTDPHGGASDIEKGLIRAVGNPEERFCEDALRILRALRFSAKLGFSIEPMTAEALYKCRALLDNISKERVYSEWQKLLSGQNSYSVISEYKDVLSVVLPELYPFAMPSEEAFSRMSAFMRMISLYALNSSGEEYESSLRGLHADNKTIKLGSCVLSLLPRFKSFSEEVLREAYISYSAEALSQALPLAHMLGVTDKDYSYMYKELCDSGVPSGLSSLSVGGDDISSLGLRGERIGKLLDALLRAVVMEGVENSKPVLLAYAEKIKDSI